MVKTCGGAVIGVLGLAALTMGCGTPAEPVCTGAGGSSALRFVWRGVGGFEGVEDAVVDEVGVPVLAIDDRCQAFVVSAPTGSSAPVTLRTTTLTPGEATDFAGDLDLGAFDATSASYHERGLSDGGTDEFWLGDQHVVSCYGCNVGNGIPSWLADADEATFEWTQTLWERSSDVAGDVRISVLTFDPGLPNLPLGTWPLATAIADHARSPADEHKGDHELLTGADADALRQLRDDYRAAHPGSFYNFVPLRDDGATSGSPQYALRLRDALPFEDADGLLSIFDVQ